MEKRDIERAIKIKKQLIWLGRTHLGFDPIVGINHWSRDRWFADVMDDDGNVVREIVRSSDICGWSGGADGGVESARVKLAAYARRQTINKNPFPIKPVCIGTIDEDQISELCKKLADACQGYEADIICQAAADLHIRCTTMALHSWNRFEQAEQYEIAFEALQKRFFPMANKGGAE